VGGAKVIWTLRDGTVIEQEAELVEYKHRDQLFWHAPRPPAKWSEIASLEVRPYGGG
jgi:hypothetical protein